MRRQISFLKISSAVVKVAAWIFLLIGIIAGGVVIFGKGSTDIPRLMGPVVLAVYLLLFFFLYLIASTADVVAELYNQSKKEG